MSSRSMHIVACVRLSSPLRAVNHTPLYVYTTIGFSIYLSMNISVFSPFGYLNNAALSMGVHISIWVTASNVCVDTQKWN